MTLAAFAVTTASAASARAGVGNDQPYPVGDQATGMGGAAVASVHDGAAPWYNPAGLGRAQAAGVSGSVSAYGFVLERTKNFYSDDDLNANLGGWVTTVFPAFIGFVKPLDVGIGDGTFRHAVGLSVVIPDFDRHQVNLSVPETTFNLSAQQRLMEQTLWVLPSWGGCVSARLCFGVAFAGAYRSSSGQYSLFFEASSPTGMNLVTASNFQEDSTQFAAAMQGGLQWRATPRWWFGLNVHSPTRTIAGGGTMTVEGTDATENGTGTPRRYWAVFPDGEPIAAPFLDVAVTGYGDGSMLIFERAALDAGDRDQTFVVILSAPAVGQTLNVVVNARESDDPDGGAPVDAAIGLDAGPGDPTGRIVATGSGSIVIVGNRDNDLTIELARL